MKIEEWTTQRIEELSDDPVFLKEQIYILVGELHKSNDEKAQELAEAHWNYSYHIICLGRNPNRIKADIAAIGWIYKQAFVHGYKHGIEEKAG